MDTRYLDEDLVVQPYVPADPRVRVLIEDMGLALCNASNCLSDHAHGDICGHQRLAAQMVRATTDHFATEFERVGNTAACDLLRDEM